ncbi:helix-turn-helix domain-containing protein [Streptomyces sp. NPDC001904]|uniref:helix-turn-helix domain-containing protein n=1 Tax=Streptomyces sp. NPDC001904 TaxID=3154531 RepID=UPI003323B4C3
MAAGSVRRRPDPENHCDQQRSMPKELTGGELHSSPFGASCPMGVRDARSRESCLWRSLSRSPGRSLPASADLEHARDCRHCEEAELELVYDSCVVPPREQAERWMDLTSTSQLPTRVRPKATESFPVRVRALGLGEVRVNTVSRAAETVSRTAALIRQNDPETYQLELIASGRKSLAHAGQSCELIPGQLVLCDSSQTLEARSVPYGPGGGRAASVLVHLPRRLLPIPSRQAAAVIASPMQTDQGPGLLLAQFLRGLIDGGSESMSVQNCGRLGVITLDLVGAVLSHQLEQDAALRADSRERLLSLRIHAYVRRNLMHADLSPAAIAAAHQISVRTLQRLCRAEGTTAAALIRLLRLQRAAQALVDPGQAEVPVHAVGARWGFPRASDFSRAFRSVYGMPPGEYRLKAREGAPG